MDKFILFPHKDTVMFYAYDTIPITYQSHFKGTLIYSRCLELYKFGKQSPFEEH